MVFKILINKIEKLKVNIEGIFDMVRDNAINVPKMYNTVLIIYKVLRSLSLSNNILVQTFLLPTFMDAEYYD